MVNKKGLVFARIRTWQMMEQIVTTSIMTIYLLRTEYCVLFVRSSSHSSLTGILNGCMFYKIFVDYDLQNAQSNAFLARYLIWHSTHLSLELFQ
jgi:hypothetical protein